MTSPTPVPVSEEVALAQLLALLIPLGIQTYTRIQQNHADTLASIEEILTDADKTYSSIIEKAKAQLQKP